MTLVKLFYVFIHDLHGFVCCTKLAEWLEIIFSIPWFQHGASKGGKKINSQRGKYVLLSINSTYTLAGFVLFFSFNT